MCVCVVYVWHLCDMCDRYMYGVHVYVAYTFVVSM